MNLRTAHRILDAGPEGGLDRDEWAAETGAQRPPEVVHPVGVQVRGAVAVHVDAQLDGADEDQVVDGRLLHGVRTADQLVRFEREPALLGSDALVAVDVPAASAREERRRGAVDKGHPIRAVRTESSPHRIY